MPEEKEITRSDDLLVRARAGERLETDERRDAIAYLLATEPGMTGMDMARLFGISEGMIRKDKDIVRKRMADDISKEDVGLIIGDIRRTYERFLSDIEKGIKKCDPGTKTYLDYQKALVDYQLKIVEALQSLGFYPKNLGTMNQNKFVFKSTVQKDGSVETKAVDPSATRTIEGVSPLKKTDESTEDKALRDMLRDEYSETPRDPSLFLAAGGKEDDSEP